MKTLLLLLVIGVLSPGTGAAGGEIITTIPETLSVLHTYEARIRVDGRVTTTQIKASDAGQAKKLVQQQFPKATVLSVKKLD
jgi:hypothetical protein